MRIAMRFLLVLVSVFALAACGTDQPPAEPTTPTGDADSTDGSTTTDGTDAEEETEDVGELTLAIASSGVPFLQVDVAEVEGFYEKHGVSVERLEVEGSAAATAAVESGQADLMVSLPEGVITARAAGSTLKMIGATVTENLYRLYVTEGIESLDDLAGEQVAMLVEGNGTDIQLRWLLDEHGAGHEQTTFVAVGGLGNRLAAIQQGQVAGTLLFPPFDEQAKASGHEALVEMREYVDGYPNEVFSAREETLEEKGDAFRAFMAAIDEATQWIIDNPEEATQIAVEATGGEQDIIEASMEFTLPTFGTEISEEGLAWTLEVMERYLVVEEVPAIEDLYDPSFLP